MKKVLAAIIAVMGVIAAAVVIMRQGEIPSSASPKMTTEVEVSSPLPRKPNLAVSNILQRPNRSLPPSEIPRLSMQEEAMLIETYRQIKLPSARFGIITALAFGGGDAAAEAFRFSLHEEFVGQPLEFLEEDTLFLTVRYLGVLAERSQAARQLLLQGCRMEYWSGRPLWKSVRDTPAMLANYSMQGIGLLPDAKVQLQAFTNGGLTRAEARRLHGSVVDAASYADRIEMFGRQMFFDRIFAQEASFGYFQQWKASEKAQPWLRWAEANGLPVSPQAP